VAQVVQHLPSKCEALSSNTTIPHKKGEEVDDDTEEANIVKKYLGIFKAKRRRK
jgi:hypothetical protein